MADPPTSGWGTPAAQVAAEAKALSEAQFVARHPTPRFIVWPVGGANAPGPPAADVFTTIRLTPSGSHKPGAQAAQPLGVLVIEKRPGSNAFTDMVTIGRASNNDLVLPDPSISKFHCYVRRLDAGWVLTDARSTNGVVVNGAQLPPAGSFGLVPGTRVFLGGSFVLEFADARSLWQRFART